MKYFYTLFLLFLNLFLLQASDYRAIHFDNIVHFENEQHYVKSLRIDSVVYGLQDTVLIPFRQTRSSSSQNCYTSKGGHWLGDRIIIKENEFHYFINKEGDSILIKTQAILNESWISHITSDSLIIEATVIQHTYENFLSLSDSVKTINFQVFDYNMNSIQHALNDKTIKISQNYGLVKTLNFYFFPDFALYYYPYEQLKEISLIGMTNPEIGFQNLTRLDIFNFQPGDETHILYQYHTIDPYSDPSQVKRTRRTILRYLSRDVLSDTVSYLIEKRETESIRHNNILVHSDFALDTINQKHYNGSSFDNLPGENFLQGDLLNSYQLLNAEPPKRIKTSLHYAYSGGYTDDCWHETIKDGCFPYNHYKKALGGPYYQCKEGTTNISNKLVYYKKGNDQWGTPLVVTSIDELQPNQQIKLYPNPTAETLYLKRNQRQFKVSQIDIIDISGRIFKPVFINTDDNIVTIQTSLLPPGLYFLRAYLDNGEQIKGVFIKQ